MKEWKNNIHRVPLPTQICKSWDTEILPTTRNFLIAWYPGHGLWLLCQFVQKLSIFPVVNSFSG